MASMHTTLIIAGTLLLGAGAFAAPAAVRAFYLYDDTQPMSEGAPTNEDPTGLSTLWFERVDGPGYATRTLALDAPMLIAREGAFHLHIDDRQSTTPGITRTFETAVRVSLFHPGGGEVLAGDGSIWALAQGRAVFSTSGGTVEAPGWSDITLDATSTAPRHDGRDCIESSCIEVTAEGVLVPAGFRLALEFGLVSGDVCGPLSLGCAFGALTASLADTIGAAADRVAEEGPIDPYAPLPAPLDQFDPIGNTIEPFIRQQDGRALAQLAQGVGLPASTWHTASVSSDSRLEIRVL